MTSVWPALCPPWKRATMSACSQSQSTILPLPSSPHWAPTTTTFAIYVQPPAVSGHQHDKPRRKLTLAGVSLHPLLGDRKAKIKPDACAHCDLEWLPGQC